MLVELYCQPNLVACKKRLSRIGEAEQEEELTGKNR